MSDPRSPFVDRGGVKPVPYSADERVKLSQQAKADRRYVPLIWLWRLLTDEDPGTGAAPADVLFEAPRVTKRYAAPIGAHVVVDQAAAQKKARRGGVVYTEGTVEVAISRAEARRLGVLLQTLDHAEGLTRDPVKQDPVYLPRPQDVLLGRDGRFYEVKQISPEYYGLDGITLIWRGTAHQVPDDLNAAGFGWLPKPPTPGPTFEEGRRGS